MKKFFPLFLAIGSILFFVSVIIKHENHLKQSQSIFIKLQPVDPRSLIQGDYMVLNYDLAWHNISPKDEITIQNQSRIMAYIQLDEQNRLISTSFSQKSAQILELKNPSNQISQLYPASNSFLFAEGLASCYERASYAEFKIKPNGKTILASLRGEHLEDLKCKNQKHWWQS